MTRQAAAATATVISAATAEAAEAGDAAAAESLPLTEAAASAAAESLPFTEAVVQCVSTRVIELCPLFRPTDIDFQRDAVVTRLS